MSKTFLLQVIQFIQTVLIQLIQFNISTDFVYTQLNVKTVLYWTIQFSASTVSTSKTVPFQTIQFSISIQFKCKCSLIVKKISIQFSQTVLIQRIRFSISMKFSSIQPVDRALLCATIPGQSGPGSNGNKGVLCIPQSSSITGTSPSECLVSYPGHSLGGGVLPLCRDAVSVFYSPS